MGTEITRSPGGAERVVLAQPVTQPASVDAHDGICGGVEVRRLAVEPDREDLLLECVSFAGERPLDDESQVGGQTLGAGEDVAGEDPIELGSHVRRGWMINRDHGLTHYAARNENSALVATSRITGKRAAGEAPRSSQNLTLMPTCSCRIAVSGIRLEIVPAFDAPIVLAGLAKTG